MPWGALSAPGWLALGFPPPLPLTRHAAVFLPFGCQPGPLAFFARPLESPESKTGPQSVVLYVRARLAQITSQVIKMFFVPDFRGVGASHQRNRPACAAAPKQWLDSLKIFLDRVLAFKSHAEHFLRFIHKTVPIKNYLIFCKGERFFYLAVYASSGIGKENDGIAWPAHR
jgi:hypothetical protein